MAHIFLSHLRLFPPLSPTSFFFSLFLFVVFFSLFSLFFLLLFSSFSFFFFFFFFFLFFFFSFFFFSLVLFFSSSPHTGVVGWGWWSFKHVQIRLTSMYLCNLQIPHPFVNQKHSVNKHTGQDPNQLQLHTAHDSSPWHRHLTVVG